MAQRKVKRPVKKAAPKVAPRSNSQSKVIRAEEDDFDMGDLIIYSDAHDGIRGWSWRQASARSRRPACRRRLELYPEPTGGRDSLGLEHLGAGLGQRDRGVQRQDIETTGVGDRPGVGGVDAVDVAAQLAVLRAQGRGSLLMPSPPRQLRRGQAKLIRSAS